MVDPVACDVAIQKIDIRTRRETPEWPTKKRGNNLEKGEKNVGDAGSNGDEE
jgi:hypothetical protein